MPNSDHNNTSACSQKPLDVCGSKSQAELFKQATRLEAGKGVAKDFVGAFNLYQQLAEQGYAPAQNKLGAKYEMGITKDPDYVLPKNIDTAIEYYQKAAKQGYTIAHYNLGRVLCNKGDREREIHHLLEAAKKENKDAQYRLGSIYQGGSGVPKNEALAGKFLRQAADQNHLMAQKKLLQEASLKRAWAQHEVAEAGHQRLKWAQEASPKRTEGVHQLVHEMSACMVLPVASDASANALHTALHRHVADPGESRY